MENYILISQLNDFMFCPYSIYLHNIYKEVDEGLYHATPQIRGRISHELEDQKTERSKKDVIQSLPVYSEKYGLLGVIDLYDIIMRKLVERKYQLKNIYQGQIYQL